MKKVVSLFVAILLVLSAFSFAMADETKTIVIGATPVPHEEVLELIKEDFEALGYKLEILEFTEYPLPNPALADGQLDANYFQHLPYLNAYNATVPESEQLVAAIPVHYEPYGIYSGTSGAEKKYAALDEVPEGGIVAITNDPSNETRALLLLAEAGLITLPEDANPESSLTVLDIVENPKKLDIREVNAEMIPSMLEDVDIAVINGNYAIGAGLKPSEDAICLEASDGDSGVTYTNYVVIRQEDVDSEWVEALRSVLQSQKVADFMLNNEDYKGGVIPAFTVE